MEFFFIVCFWLFFAYAAGMFATIRRNRSPQWWALSALLFSPLVAFILLAILMPKPRQEKTVGDFLAKAA
jgi:hypothetical protein